MKLVIATPLYPPELGGPATYAKLLSEHLPEAGDDVDLVKFSSVRHLPKVVRHVSYYWKVLRAARGADLILALDPVSVGFPALLAARTLAKPFVVKVVGDFAWEQGKQRFGVTASLDEFVKETPAHSRVGFLRSIQTYVARRAECVIVPSNYLKGIVTAWGISPEKISVIYNSVELPEISIRSAHEKAAQIVSVGRFVPWKGMEALIDAVAEVRKEIPDVSLRLVGDGPDKALLERKGKELLGNAIMFTGPLSHEETLRTMKYADIFVLNSSYEGLSHTVIEALMLGNTIVVSDAGGNPELIHDGENGLVVQTGDTPALVAALMKLLKDESLRARLGARAQESSARFSLSLMIEKTHALLSSAVKK
jgi:glycosyltransferase involved in cell wall biosynthesis